MPFPNSVPYTEEYSNAIKLIQENVSATEWKMIFDAIRNRIAKEREQARAHGDSTGYRRGYQDGYAIGQMDSGVVS